MKITVPYKSLGAAVALPALTFALLPLLLAWQLDTRYDFPFPFGFGAIVIILYIVALVLAILLYKPYARAIQKKAELNLESTKLTYKIGSKLQEINLNKPYAALFTAGSETGSQATSAGIEFRFEKDKKKRLYMFMLHPTTIAFAESLFFINQPNTTYGIELNAHDQHQEQFFNELLKTLWQTREQNAAWKTFKTYTWDKTPKPEHDFVEYIEDVWPNPTNTRVKKIINEAFWSATESFSRTLFLSKDYVMAYNVNKRYELFPLGNTIARFDAGSGAETSFKSPELIFKGVDENGKEVSKAVNWNIFDPLDYNKEFVPHFVNVKNAQK